MQKINKKDWILFGIVVLVAVIGEILFFNKQGDFMVDVGREFYLSKEVALGKLLYKDIFNIYGPLSYQINAILFKIFGFHTDVMVVAGNLCGLAICAGMYVLCRQFLPRVYSFVILLVVIFTGIYTNWIFNYTVSYCYAMIYGLLLVIVSLISLIWYVRNSEKSYYLYLSMFLAGGLVVLKYDYWAFLLVFPFAMFLVRTNIKTAIKGCVCFCVIPLTSTLSLFAGGLNFQDALYNISLIRRCASAPSLQFFYETVKVSPSWEQLFFTILNLLWVGGAFALIYKLLCKIKIKWQYITILLCVFLILGGVLKVSEYFSFLSILITILLCVLNKKIKDKSYWVLFIASLLLSIKSFLCSRFHVYGLYSFPFVLLSCIVLLRTYVFKNEKVFKHCLIALLVFMLIPVGGNMLNQSKYNRVKVVTEYGQLNTHRELAPIKLLIEFLQKNVSKDDTVVVLPEGHIINFLTGTKSDDFYSNFIPMYVEAFGEQNIINHYKENMPDYFVLSTRDTGEYGYTGICKDYAVELCNWIFNNYYVTAKIVGEPQYVILRKNQ